MIVKHTTGVGAVQEPVVGVASAAVVEELVADDELEEVSTGEDVAVADGEGRGPVYSTSPVSDECFP